jgi:DnaJ domain
MPARPTLPADDLYARLGVPRDASPEAIELAWRALLRRHHPDVAGPGALELAKRINVAHDWLSDPELRRRYDQERTTGIRAGRPPRAGPDWGTATPRRTVRRPPTLAERVASVIERIGRLTGDELDRLALAEPAPIAFLATLRQFVEPDLERTLQAAERDAMAALPAAARRLVPIRDAVVGQLADVIMGDVLDEILGDPSALWARERLTRGWDSAVGQPRYGPATATVTATLERCRRLDADGLRRLAATGTIERLGDPPWADGTSPEEDDALRVSSELAAADASDAIDAAVAVCDGSVGPRTAAAARRAARRVAHLLVLRHAFTIAAFGRHAAPWLGDLIERTAPWGARARGH